MKELNPYHQTKFRLPRAKVQGEITRGMTTTGVDLLQKFRRLLAGVAQRVDVQHVLQVRYVHPPLCAVCVWTKGGHCI